MTPAPDPEAVRASLVGRFAPVVDLLAGRLGDQLVAVLVHGSAMRGCPTADDFDLIIALRSPAVASVRVTRESLTTVNWDRPLEVQVVCVDQMPVQGDHYSLKAAGPWIINTLRRALVLYGENPYSRINPPTPAMLKRSLVAEVQRNLWFARNAAGQGAARLTDNEIYQVAKKVWWSMRDLLMWIGKEGPDAETDLGAFSAVWPDALDARHWEVLRSWLPMRGRERELFENLDGVARTEFLERVLQVHEAIYATILELAAQEFGLQFVADGAERQTA